MSLAELLIATAIMSLISIAAFRILAEGSQYLHLNQTAIDAQRSGLTILSQLGSGIQSTRQDLIASGPEGLVFASPYKDDGTVEFDAVDRGLVWQKWVCFYREQDRVSRRELDISLPSSSPGAPPLPSTFASVPVFKSLAKDVTQFSVSQISASPPLWSLDLTVGDVSDPDYYGIELHSEVGPRN